jgi:hypothetical protein
MRLGSWLAGFLFLTLLCTGCATRQPFRSLPAGERRGAQVLDVTPRSASSYSSADSRALRETGAQSGLLPALIMSAAAETVEGKGLPWVSSIRAQSGLDEANVVTESIRQRVRMLDASNMETNGGPVLEVFVQEVGLAELQRGGYFGAVGMVLARLRNANGKELWSGVARSTSTRQRRREEYDAKPGLYAEDFREVAEDIARQLIDGPIR